MQQGDLEKMQNFTEEDFAAHFEAAREMLSLCGTITVGVLSRREEKFVSDVMKEAERRATQHEDGVRAYRGMRFPKAGS